MHSLTSEWKMANYSRRFQNHKVLTANLVDTRESSKESNAFSNAMERHQIPVFLEHSHINYSKSELYPTASPAERMMWERDFNFVYVANHLLNIPPGGSQGKISIYISPGTSALHRTPHLIA